MPEAYPDSRSPARHITIFRYAFTCLPITTSVQNGGSRALAADQPRRLSVIGPRTRRATGSMLRNTSGVATVSAVRARTRIVRFCARGVAGRARSSILHIVQKRAPHAAPD